MTEATLLSSSICDSTRETISQSERMSLTSTTWISTLLITSSPPNLHVHSRPGRMSSTVNIRERSSRTSYIPRRPPSARLRGIPAPCKWSTRNFFRSFLEHCPDCPRYPNISVPRSRPSPPCAAWVQRECPYHHRDIVLRVRR